MSKGHSDVMLEDELASSEFLKMHCFNRPCPWYIMAFPTDTDKATVAASAMRPAKKPKTSRTHCCRDKVRG